MQTGSDRDVKRPSGAMAVAMLALFVALGGSATALRGKNTVFSDDIRNGAVRGPDLARNAVTGPKIADGTVSGADVAERSLHGASIPGVDAATLNGLDEDAFAPASQHLSKLVSLDDPEDTNTEDGVTKRDPLIQAGPIRLSAWCLDDPTTSQIDLRLMATVPDGVWWTGVGHSLVPQAPGSESMIAGGVHPGDAHEGASFHVSAEGTTLHGKADLVWDSWGSDCTFAVSATAIGAV